VTNDEIKLRPGQFVRGFLKSKETEGLIVPRSAILWTGKRSVVYVKEPNHSAPSFMMREVVPGAEVDHYVVITEGLQKGEIVVSQGVFRVDAAAQLAGKPGMMSPEDGMSNSGHDHGMISKPMKSNEKKEQDMTKEEIRHETFKISGLCGMCKDRIEKTTLSLNGVIEASWSAETQILDIRYNPAHITLQEVHKAVAAVGHDTELEKAPDEVYEALPACCLYR